MSTTILEELSDPRTQLWPLTVEQYHEMIKTGILAEGAPFELIECNIVRKDRSAAGEDPMTVGIGHALAVNKLARLSQAFEPLGAFVQTQQPVTIEPNSEPEPDAAVVFGQLEDYATRLPSAADVTCIIEVADASLRRDRTTKRTLYSNAGIPMYVIVNLLARQLEVYEQADGSNGYEAPKLLAEDATIVLPGPDGRSVAVAVRDMLP